MQHPEEKVSTVQGVSPGWAEEVPDSMIKPIITSENVVKNKNKKQKHV